METRVPQHGTALGAPEPFRRLLVASSLDADGVRVALRAARLPLAPGARVVLLHVADASAAAALRPRDARRSLETIAAAAHDVARAAGNEAPEFVPRVGEGTPAAEIVEAARTERAEIVVVGPPPERLDGSAGATIPRVLRKAGLPLLVVRSDATVAYRHVLCAVDLSESAIDAAALAVRIARPTALGFTLFHAYHVPFEPMLHDAPGVEEEAIARVRAVAHAMQDEVGNVRLLVRRGEPGVEMVRAAVREHAELIVVAAHARSALARLFEQSGAEWVIASAPFDVAVAAPRRPPRAGRDRR